MLLKISLFTIGAITAIGIVLYADKIARQFSLIDQPDKHRKLHKKPTPLVGGIALFLATCLGMIAVITRIEITLLILVTFAAGTTFFALGLADDRKHVHAWSRLGIGTAILLLLVTFEPKLQIQVLWFNEFGGVQGLGFLSIPYTVFCVLCVKHSANMADGVNGLLIGLCLLWLALLAPWLTPEMVTFFAPISGALCVLLIANLKGRIFTGDSGAYLMGTHIALAAISLYVNQQGALSAEYLAAIFLIPVLDMGRLMISRCLRGQRMMSADRGHFHHHLENLFGNKTKAVTSYLAVCALPALHAYLGVALLPLVAVQVAVYAMLLYMANNKMTR